MSVGSKSKLWKLTKQGWSSLIALFLDPMDFYSFDKRAQLTSVDRTNMIKKKTRIVLDHSVQLYSGLKIVALKRRLKFLRIFWTNFRAHLLGCFSD